MAKLARAVQQTLIAFLATHRCASPSIQTTAQVMEDDRLAEYQRRNYTWPPDRSEYVPGTEGWIELCEERLRQIDYSVTSPHENLYNAYMFTLLSGMAIQNFTELGWGLTTAPDNVFKPIYSLLSDAIHNNKLRYEEWENAIRTTAADETTDGGRFIREQATNNGLDPSIEFDEDNPLRPMFLWNAEMARLRNYALQELQPLVEAWAGVPVKPVTAYGMRVYQNSSRLYMHVDQPKSHVVSAIFHVYHDHENDSKPWPLAIEAFDGKTYAVPLKEGEILLYESSKCYHGRPIQFHGRHYSSMYLHYMPLDYSDGLARQYATHFRIPSHYRQQSAQRRTILEASKAWGEEGSDNVVETTAIESFFVQTECEYEWCGMEDAVWVNDSSEKIAPAFGKVLTGYGESAKIRDVFKEYYGTGAEDQKDEDEYEPENGAQYEDSSSSRDRDDEDEDAEGEGDDL